MNACDFDRCKLHATLATLNSNHHDRFQKHQSIQPGLKKKSARCNTSDQEGSSSEMSREMQLVKANSPNLTSNGGV
jgi:hypothetical protein